MKEPKDKTPAFLELTYAAKRILYQATKKHSSRCACYACQAWGKLIMIKYPNNIG